MARRRLLSEPTKYDTIKIPEGLTRKIDELVKRSEGDFTSRTDVIKYAVRILYRGKND